MVKKRNYVNKSMRKGFKRLSLETITKQITFTGRKLGSRFNIKDETKFENKHVIYYGK